MRAKKRKNSKQFNERFRKRFFTKKAVLVIVCAAVILVVAAFACQSQRKRAAGLRETVEELSTEIRDLEDANETLKEEKDNMDSPEFKEKMARERLGMIGEDEYSLQQSEDAGGEEAGAAGDGDSVEDSGSAGGDEGENPAGEDGAGDGEEENPAGEDGAGDGSSAGNGEEENPTGEDGAEDGDSSEE